MKICFFSLLISVSLFACSDSITYTTVVDNPSPLIAKIESYQSIEIAKKQLLNAGYDWKVLENSKLPPNDSRPPFDILAASISNYKYLNHQGELVLIFFNNRLMTTIFYPDDVPAFVHSFKQEKGIDLISQPEVLISKYTEIWFKIDYQKRKYIRWHDVRLMEEERRWISTYS